MSPIYPNLYLHQKKNYTIQKYSMTNTTNALYPVDFSEKPLYAIADREQLKMLVRELTKEVLAEMLLSEFGINSEE